MKRLFHAAVIGISIGYPFLIYWGLQRYDARVLLPLLFILLVLRWFTGRQKSDRLIVVGSTAIVLMVTFVWDTAISLKFYPMIVNLGFLVIFASSLIFPPTVIERFARIQNSELGPSAITYTRKVTWVWSFFFVVNGSIAAATALWGSEEIWVLYNGFIAYVLIAILFVGEWLLRRRITGL